MKKIKLSIPGFSSNVDISQYIGNTLNTFNDCVFYINDSTITEVDYWFILDDLHFATETVIVNPENIYLLTAEVINNNRGLYNSLNRDNFLNQFANIITCHDIIGNNIQYDIPFSIWMINANHGQSIFEYSLRDLNWFKNLKIVDKTELISVFCSNKIDTPDHLLRFKFVEILKKHFGDSLHWYGNGINSKKQKWEGIAPYKYHVALENQSRHNIITEKIYDTYLGLSFPIYWGAPNLNEYFPKNSFEQIEIIDWRKSIKQIELLLKNDIWEESLPLIIESKDKVLKDYNFFYRISNLTKKDSIKSKIQKITLCSSSNSSKTVISRLLNKTGKILINSGNYLTSFN